MKNTNIITDQVNGAIINSLEAKKEAVLEKVLEEIHNSTKREMAIEDEALKKALNCIDNVREFVSSPNNILGSDLTKHGEIAEQVEVNISNARDIMNRLSPRATFEGVGRTAPEDYRIDGVNIQSKFINGTNNTLKHVLEHLDKYKDFTDDGGYYHVPKEQYDIMVKIHNGNNVEGLNGRSVSAIRNKILEIEQETGQDFNQVVKPSISNYNEVQQGKINETLNTHEDDIRNLSSENKNKIEEDAHKRTQAADEIVAPSLKEAAKYGAIAAVIGGVTSSGMSIYNKHKEGKNISSYTSEDWQDVGFEFGKGSIRGGISGTSIYGLTKFAGCSAPLASAVVSTSFGVASLTKDYISGNVEVDEFVEQGQALCIESAMVAVGAAIGQTIIPIPVVGTLIGSFATKALLDITKQQLDGRENQLAQKINKQFNDALEKMDTQCRILMDKIQKYYDKLDGLLNGAFNFDVNYNLTFSASISLCRHLGVKEEEILHNETEVDDYFMN